MNLGLRQSLSLLLQWGEEAVAVGIGIGVGGRTSSSLCVVAWGRSRGTLHVVLEALLLDVGGRRHLRQRSQGFRCWF